MRYGLRARRLVVRGSRSELQTQGARSRCSDLPGRNAIHAANPAASACTPRYHPLERNVTGQAVHIEIDDPRRIVGRRIIAGCCIVFVERETTAMRDFVV